jgi:hypothetical protein
LPLLSLTTGAVIMSLSTLSTPAWCTGGCDSVTGVTGNP